MASAGSSLSGASSVGGVVIPIQLDMASLRASIGTAKSSLTSAGRDLTLNVTVRIDAGAVATAARTAVNAASRSVPPLVIPVEFREGASGFNGARSGMSGRRAGPAAGAGGAGGGMSGWGALLAAAGAIGSVEGAGQIFQANKLFARGGPSNQAQARLQQLQGLKAIPGIGHAASALDSWVGAEKSQQGLVDQEQAKFESFQQATDPRLREGINARLASARGDGGRALAIGSDRRIQDLKVLAGKSGVSLSKEIEAERQIGAIELRDYNERKTARFIGLSAGASASAGSADAARLALAGDSLGALRADRQAGRAALSDQNFQQLVGVKDPNERGLIAKANASKLEAYDLQSAKAIDDQKRQRAAETIAALGQIEATRLQKVKEGYKADLAAFDSANAAKLATITDVAQKQEAVAVGAAQRGLLIQQQLEAKAASIRGYAVTAQTAELRAGQQDQTADFVAFDAETDETAEDLDEERRGRYLDSRRRQRAALGTTQARSQRSTDIGIDTRIGQARARASGLGRVADLRGTLGGYEQELLGAQVKDRGQIRQAQFEELNALKQSLTRPTSYAAEFDIGREALGGPTGRGGAETNTLLTEIAKWTKRSAEKQEAMPPVLRS